MRFLHRLSPEADYVTIASTIWFRWDVQYYSINDYRVVIVFGDIISDEDDEQEEADEQGEDDESSSEDDESSSEDDEQEMVLRQIYFHFCIRFSLSLPGIKEYVSKDAGKNGRLRIGPLPPLLPYVAGKPTSHLQKVIMKFAPTVALTTSHRHPAADNGGSVRRLKNVSMIFQAQGFGDPAISAEDCLRGCVSEFEDDERRELRDAVLQILQADEDQVKDIIIYDN